MRRNWLLAATMATTFLVATLSLANAARADGASDYVLSIKDHVFTPNSLEIPANQKIRLIVKNLDATAEEFESYDLNREKIVAGNSEITVLIGPLDPGTYQFFGDFHPDSAHGTIIAK